MTKRSESNFFVTDIPFFSICFLFCSIWREPYNNEQITFQPIQFNALDHEKRFRIILTGLLILITVYAFAIYELANVIEPGAEVFKSTCMPVLLHVYLLNSGPSRADCLAGNVIPISILTIHGITASSMIAAEFCARIMRPANASTAGNPVILCSPSFIVNNIPFFSLNSSIALVFGLQVTLHAFAKFLKLNKSLVLRLQMPCLLLIAILATNKLARKHIALRLRQYFDVFTIGRNNTSSNASSVSTIVVPVRGQPTTNTLILVPQKRNSLCPVGE